jgi:hypothetical protein
VFSLPVCADRVGAAGVPITAPLIADAGWTGIGVDSAVDILKRKKDDVYKNSSEDKRRVTCRAQKGEGV